MKKVFALLFALSIGLGMISCSSDDDSSSTPQFTIVGTWKVTQAYFNGIEQNVADVCIYKGTAQFINGGTYVENKFDLNDADVCVQGDAIGGTWAKSGNNYTLTFNSGQTSNLLNNTFTTVLNSDNINKFEVVSTAGGTTRLIFTKQ